MSLLTFGHHGLCILNSITQNFANIVRFNFQRAVITIACLSVCLSVRHARGPRRSGLRYEHSFSPYDTVIIQVFVAKILVVGSRVYHERERQNEILSLESRNFNQYVIVTRKQCDTGSKNCSPWTFTFDDIRFMRMLWGLSGDVTLCEHML